MHKDISITVNDIGGRWDLSGSEQFNVDTGANTEPPTKAPMPPISIRHPHDNVADVFKQQHATASEIAGRGIAANLTNKHNQNISNVKRDFFLTGGLRNSTKKSDSIGKNGSYYHYTLGDSFKERVDVPHFSEKSWIAFPVLRGAYKYVQVRNTYICIYKRQ